MVARGKSKSVARGKKLTKKNKKYTNRGSRGGASRGGSRDNILQFLVLYPNFENKPITNGINLSGRMDIYNKQPKIILQNAIPNNKYLLVMYDPDAPNGIENKLANHIYIHWVALFQNANMIKEYVKYAPPTPPIGTHRYYFVLYDLTKCSIDSIGSIGSIDSLQIMNNKIDTRSNYYYNKLKSLLSKCKILSKLYFSVKK